MRPVSSIFGRTRVANILVSILAPTSARLLVALLMAFAALTTTSSAAPTTYEYDALGRLKVVTEPDGTITTYTLDPAGNRSEVVTTIPALPGVIQLSTIAYKVAENDATVTITATRTGGDTGAVGVSYSTSNGTAAAGSDYTAASGSLSWANADTASKTFTVSIADDSVGEGDESFTVSLATPSGGATLGSLSSATVTILDNENPAPGSIQLTAPAYSVGESGLTVTITASRTDGSAGAVGVSYSTSNGTATSGSDYTAASGTLSWAHGDTANKTFTVGIADDTAVEGSENFNASIASPTGGATLGSPASATVAIADNDNPPSGSIQLSAAAYSVGESGPTVTIAATRTGGSFGPVGVSYSSSNGTAGLGDFANVSGMLSWSHGDTANKTFTVTIYNDTDIEGDENFTVSLSSPTGGATLGPPASATVTITDNDHPPSGSIQLASATYSVAENGSTLTILVTRSGGTYGTVGVSYGTSNGTAAAGSDYTAISGTLSWAHGDGVAKAITIPILNDTTVESAETFIVALSAPTGDATLGSPSSATVTINDEDTNQPTVPGNLRVNPASGTGGSYTILWDASNGVVNHYTLNEVRTAPTSGTATYAVTGTSRAFSKGNVYLSLQYQVRACATADESQCSAYSGFVFKNVCPSTGCP